jgi:voltage-gated potassium channel
VTIEKDKKTVRNQLLRSVERITETPLMILGFVWLGLLMLELLNRSTAFLESAGIVIWIIFIFDFIVRFLLAPVKIKYLKSNVITIISLVVPAVRLFRLIHIVRLIRLSRSLRLIKVIGSINRGMRVLALTMQRRGFGYVLMLSVIVFFVGGAGMFAFERNVNVGFSSYGTSLWWTAMVIISMGTENWPKTPEGRTLSFLIAVYGYAVFGYVTATIATFFIGKDAEDERSELAGTRKINDLKKEITLLRKEIEKLHKN